jgi:phospholipid-binding lipoprotein MlaA
MRSTLDTRRASAWLMILISAVALSGCVSQEQMADENSGYVEYDPLEPLNRKIHSFNMAADRAVMRPLARGYRKVIPGPVRTSVSNFFSNLRTPGSSLNNFLQGKPKRGFSELGRFLFNTTLGIGGLFDVAGRAGLERYDEDFAETLSVWGVPDGPYVVLPFWGPNMMSDAVALPVDYYTDILTYYDDSSVRDKLWGLRLINLRYRVLPADAILEESQDTYVTVREAYRQNRRFRVFDGNPPTEEEEEDFYEDELFDEFFGDEELEATPETGEEN